MQISARTLGQEYGLTAEEMVSSKRWLISSQPLRRNKQRKNLWNQLISEVFGPSGATRTRGFHIPNVAPYQLGYTRIFCCDDYSTKLVQFKVFSCLWSFMWSKRVFGPVSQLMKIPQTTVLQGVPDFGCSHRGYTENRSQTTRATNCANPGYCFSAWSGRTILIFHLRGI